MNMRLRDAMDERARQAAEAPVDLGPVLAAGDRRRRVRGLAAVGVAGVVVAAVAVAGATLLPVNDTATVSAGPNVASYASGSIIHVGDDAIDVGDHEIHAYVRTQGGFVFSNADGEVYFADGASTERIGSGVLRAGDVRESGLRAEPGGSYVAWVDEGPEVPEFVVYDTASMTEMIRTSEGNDVNRGPNFETKLASIVSIDHSGVYVINGIGLARIDVDTGVTEQLKAGPVSEFDVMDARDGLVLHTRPGRSWDDRTRLILGPGYSSKGTRLPAFTDDISPDGRHTVGTTEVYAGKLRITDIASGRVTRLTSSGYTSFSRPMWLDSNTVLAGGIRPGESDVTDLVTCDLEGGPCRTVATGLGDFGTYQLPDGEFKSDAGL